MTLVKALLHTEKLRQLLTRKSEQPMKTAKEAYLFVINSTLYCILWFNDFRGNDMIDYQYVPICDNGVVIVMEGQRPGTFERVWFVKHNWKSGFVFVWHFPVYQGYSGMRRNNTSSTWFYVWQLLHASLRNYKLNIFLASDKPYRQSYNTTGLWTDDKEKSHGNQLPKMEAGNICFFCERHGTITRLK